MGQACPHSPVRRDRRRLPYPVWRGYYVALYPVRRDKARVFKMGGSGSFFL